MYELATGQNGKYCRNSTECKEFLNTESGFCNFDHNITGFCESCDDIFESCVGQGFLCERGFRECSSTCEGKDIHFVINCNHYTLCFVYQYLSNFPSCLAPLDTSTWHKLIVPELIIAVSAISTIIVLVIVILCIWYCKRLQKNNNTSAPATWEKNSNYDYQENLHQGLQNESILPDWLEERKEIIFPPECIKKGKRIGQGQFGSVFKGLFTQGNAV